MSTPGPGASMRVALASFLCVGLAVPTSAHPQSPAESPARADTRLGNLEFENDYPTPETVRKLRDELLFQAAVQVYLWSLPIMDVVAVRDCHQAAGVENTGIPIFESFLSPRTIVPTGNQETIYAYGVVTLGGEPMVFEAPPGTAGFIADAWQRPIQDVGPTGPDEGKGGRFLLVPPGHEGDLPEAGYFVARSPTRNVWWLLRGSVKDGETGPAVEALRQVRLHPLSRADAPPPQQYENLSGVPIRCIPPRGFAYWETLAKVLQEERVQERDRVVMGMAAHIGIEQGKPFKPDTRTRTILAEAEKVAWAMSTSLAFASESPAAKVHPDREWEHCFLTKSPIFETESYVQLYSRSAFAHQAMAGASSMVVAKVGAGSQCIATFKDGAGNYLTGAGSYRLTVPPDVPIDDFWSVAVYDTATRSLVDTGRPSSTRSSNMELQQNDDGSIDLHFGPSMPAAGEANWVKTNPGKGFFLYFRFYGPLEPFFDKTWKPGDLVELDTASERP
jgi:hypothetical protein